SIVSAKIKIRNIDTAEVRSVDTLATGDYTVSYLRPGLYEVTIEAPGFRPLHESGLELKLDQTARLDATLEVGSSVTAVEVTASAPVLNTENSSRGDVIAGRE